MNIHSAVAHSSRGIFYFLRRRRLNRALARYQKNPGLPETLRLAKACLSLQRSRQALEVAAEGRRRFPEDRDLQTIYERARIIQAHVLLGKALRALHAECTVDHYVRVIELYRALGDFTSAFQYAKDARVRYPEQWGIHFALGKLHYYHSAATGNREDREEALRHLQDSRNLNPDHYNTLILLGITLARLEEFKQAKALVAEILERVPSDPRAQQLSAYIEGASRQPPPKVPAVPQEQQKQAAMEQPVGVQEDRATSRLLRDIMAAIPGTVGLFLFDINGNPVDSLTTPNDVFDFQGRMDGIRSLAQACHFDSRRIGIGNLRSCVVSGKDWHVSMHPQGNCDLVAFLGAATSTQDAERELRGILEGSLVANSNA